MNNVYEVLTTYIECLIVYLILMNIFKCRKGVLPYLFGAVSTVVVIFINEIQFFSYIAVVVPVVLASAIVKAFTKEKMLSIISISTVYYTFVHILDFFCLSVFCIVSGNIEETVSKITSASDLRYVYIIFVKLVTIIIYLCFRKKICNLKINSKYMAYIFVASILIFLFDSVAVNAFLNSSYRLLRVGIGIEWFLVMLFVVYMMYTSIKITEFGNERKEFQLVELKNQMLLENLNDVREDYLKSAKRNHDFKHHLGLISGYVESGNTQKALDYINSLEYNSVKLWDCAYTEIEEINIILNYKISQARKEGIIVDVEIGLNDVGNIEAKDICLILSNALDNAIEACLRCEKDRYIDIKIMRNNGIITFVISNTTDLKEIEGDYPKSSKNKKGHGFGLKSIRSTAQKYDGVMNIELKNGKFTIIVTLFTE